MTILTFPEQATVSKLSPEQVTISKSTAEHAAVSKSSFAALHTTLIELKQWLRRQTDHDGSLTAECPLSAQFMISDLLTVKGFNLTRIALELDVSKASISRLWRGLIRMPHGKTLRKLVMLYSTTLENNPLRKPLPIEIVAKPAA